MHDDEIIIFDFDNVIYFSKSSSALEDFLKSHPSRKAKLFYPSVATYLLFTKAVQRITQFKTGESTILSALDIILRKHLVQAIVRYAGIEVSGIYGNEFDVYDGKIHGFKRYKLDAGMSAKYFRTKILLYEYEKEYGSLPSKIYAVGDSIADRGINGYLGVPVIRYEVKDINSSLIALNDIVTVSSE